ncbi:hypothetical protein BJV77DRAFT_547647 [Russula vinacea]|nr:hypothetical protein BJV77DRAFT_547647 [Russula vinacea]
MPIYLVPTNDGTGKRFVHCPHPPHTTAPLPDGFNAITKRVTTRPSTTKLPIPRSTLTTTRSPSHPSTPNPNNPRYRSTHPFLPVPPRASWALARTCADRDVAVMVTTAKRAALRVASVTMVVIGAHRTAAEWARKTRSTCPRRRCRLRCHFRRAAAPQKGGTTSWKNWCESIAKNASETFRGGRGAGAGASADDGAAAASGGGSRLVVPLVVKVRTQ